MRIYSPDQDRSLDEIVLYLTKKEAEEMKNSLESIIDRPSNNHAHIDDYDFQKELTICIYDIDNLKDFNTRSKEIIIYNK